MTFAELRQMMHPDSGLLWSPWFRWAAISFRLEEGGAGRAMGGNRLGGGCFASSQSHSAPNILLKHYQTSPLKPCPCP